MLDEARYEISKLIHGDSEGVWRFIERVEVRDAFEGNTEDALHIVTITA